MHQICTKWKVVYQIQNSPTVWWWLNKSHNWFVWLKFQRYEVDNNVIRQCTCYTILGICHSSCYRNSPILKSSSCLTSTASLIFLLGCSKFCRALFTDTEVISENFARNILRLLLIAVHTSIISNPMFSPSLSQSVQMIRPWQPRTSLSRVFWKYEDISF